MSNQITNQDYIESKIMTCANENLEMILKIYLIQFLAYIDQLTELKEFNAVEDVESSAQSIEKYIEEITTGTTQVTTELREKIRGIIKETEKIALGILNN